MEAVSVTLRLERLCAILLKEIEILELERKINTRVRKQMERTQKEYYLREQMKAIQKELGERDERQSEAEEYLQRLKKRDCLTKPKKRPFARWNGLRRCLLWLQKQW